MKKSPVRLLIGLLLLSSAVFGYSLYYTDPRTGVITISIFVGSLSFGIFALISLVAYGLRRVLFKGERRGNETRASLREGLLAALYLAVVLGLAGIKLLTWWDAGLLAFSLILFEVYFSSGKEQVL